jgi:RNA polymerase sigma-70 factor (ECF subfamily)
VTDLAAAPHTARDGLVERAVAGDETAFARLIAEHTGAMSRVAYVIVGDRDLTLDAVQSAWTIAWQRLRSLRDHAQVGPWLIAIAANEARQQRRRARRGNVVDISERLDRPGSVDPAASAETVDLERALRKFSGDDRRLLALRFVAGFDSTEIAGALGISASGVRSRLSRLIERLRAELTEGESA